MSAQIPASPLLSRRARWLVLGLLVVVVGGLALFGAVEARRDVRPNAATLPLGGPSTSGRGSLVTPPRVLSDFTLPSQAGTPLSLGELRGRVVLLGSITAEMTGQGDAAYAAGKAGVAHLGRQFAREWVRQGVNVNVIQPGYIRTEIDGDWFDSDGGKAQIAAFHRKRMCPIEALDAPLLLLASDASAHITGSTLTVDDGQVL